MKRTIALILAVLCLTSMLGCKAANPLNRNEVTFYYIRQQYQFSSQENVIAAETRALSGNSGDLGYLLTLYMLGPLDEELSSPFPKDVSILDIQREETRVMITLSAMDNTVSDSKFSLAGACLALTILDLTDCDTVQLFSGERNIILRREDILLTDDITSTGSSTEETQ